MRYILFVVGEHASEEAMNAFQGERKYEFEFASNGKEAIEKLQSSHLFSLMVLELGLSDFDPWELLEYLREANCQIPTVVLTAYDDRENLRKAANEPQVVGFLNQPFSHEALKAQIDHGIEMERYVIDRHGVTTVVRPNQTIRPYTVVLFAQDMRPKRRLNAIRRMVDRLSSNRLEEMANHVQQRKADLARKGLAQQPQEQKAGQGTLVQRRIDRVLFVEDEPTPRAALDDIFAEDERYEFEFASNGKEAVDKLDSGRPFDLMLLDLRMPKLDGWELLEHLREVNCQIPTLVLTAYDDRENLYKAANETQIVGFLDKLAPYEKLEAKIQQGIEVGRYVGGSGAVEYRTVVHPRQYFRTETLGRILREMWPDWYLNVAKQSADLLDFEQLESLEQDIHEYKAAAEHKEREAQQQEEIDRERKKQGKPPLKALESRWLELQEQRITTVWGEQRVYYRMKLRWLDHNGRLRSRAIRSADFQDEETYSVICEILEQKNEQDRRKARTFIRNLQELERRSPTRRGTPPPMPPQLADLAD